MSSKRKSRASNVPAAKAPPPQSHQVSSSSAAGAGAGSSRLGLYIILLGVLFVIGVGGIFVWLNRQNPPSAGPPPLAAGWVPGPVNQCRGSPRFPLQLGFSRSVIFSTSERLNKGMQLIEPGPNGDLASGRNYQHPSWTMGGYLGVFVVDRDGNLYVAPSPRISLLDNPPEKANILYKIDSDSGVMSEYFHLPFAAPPPPENPYGILALAYDCDTHSLYVTSVMGSTRANEVGRIYRIDLNTRMVAAQYENTDAFGVAAFNHPEGKRLYFGSPRAPEVRSIALDAEGNFWGEPRGEFFLTGLFNRPRRLEFNARGEMLVRGIDFNFTLSATSQDRRTDYVMEYDDAEKKWIQIAP